MTNILSKIAKAALGAVVMSALVLGFAANNASAATTYNFATNLKMGQSSNDVKMLQMCLNTMTTTPVATSGTGSAGMESTYFGAKTQAAVIAYQNMHVSDILTPAHLTAGNGFVGSLTRAALNITCNGTAMTPPSQTLCPNGNTMASNCMTPPTAPTQPSTLCPNGNTFASNCMTPPTGGNPSMTGPLTAMLSTDNPATGNLIQGQATADMLHVTFTGTGTINQLTFQRSGISDNSVFPNVYLYNGNTRLTDSASVNSMGQIIFNGLNIAVNGSMNISVKADIVAGTTVESTAMVTLTSYMVSGSTTATTVSIAGNSMYINSGTGILSTVGVGCNTAAGANGTLPACTNTSAAASVSAGTTGYSLWSAPVYVSLHSVWLKSAAFDVIGSAPSNAFANLGLYVNGVQIATSTGVNAMGYISFIPTTPYSLATGTATLEVRGDIVNGSARTVQLSLQHASDLMVTDSQVGVNVSVVTQGTSTFTINQANTVSIQQGTLVAQSDPTFNSQTNVTGGASNVAIASYKLTSYGEDVKVNTVTVTPVITGSPLACSALATGAVALNNVTLYYNGAPIGSSQNAVSTAGGCTMTPLIFTPGSNLTISGGTTGVFQVHADLVNGAGTPQYSTGTIGANVSITQYQGITSGQTGSVTLSGSNALTMQTGTLTVASNAAYLSQTISPNTSGAQIASFVLQNQSTSEAVQVNSLNVGLYTNSTLGTQLTTVTALPTTNFSTLTLTGVSGTITPIGQPTGMNTFSTNFTIPAGGQQTINVIANLGATTGQSFVVSLQPIAVGASSRVVISSTATAGQLIALGVGTLATPTLIGSQSTNAQYISSGGTGATNAAQETYNFVASSGTANIVGLKFAALAGTGSTSSYAGTAGAAGAYTAATYTATQTTLTVGANANSYSTGTTLCNGVGMQCNFLVTTDGIYGGTDAVVTGYYSGANTNFVITAVQTPMVAGSPTSGTVTGTTHLSTTVDGITAGLLANVHVGDYVSGDGIPAGDYVSAITSPSTAVSFTLNAAVTSGNTTGPLTFTGAPTTIYQLATTGATGVALNSTGVATGTATFSNGIAYLSSIMGANNASGAMVPNTPSGVTLPVFVSYGPVSSTSGVASGTTSAIRLEYVQYQTGSNTSYLAPTASTATGTTITLVGSKPNITLNPSTATLTNGSSVLLGTVTVTADNTGDISLSEIPLVVSISVGNGGATPTIVANHVTLTDTNGAAIGGTFTATNSAGTTSATASEVFGSGTSGHYRISAGSYKTFEIHADFTGTSFGTSATASVSLAPTSLGSPYDFVWDDVNGGVASNVATNGTYTSGLTGASLFSYPSGSVSIHN